MGRTLLPRCFRILPSACGRRWCRCRNAPSARRWPGAAEETCRVRGPVRPSAPAPAHSAQNQSAPARNSAHSARNLSGTETPPRTRANSKAPNRPIARTRRNSAARYRRQTPSQARTPQRAQHPNRRRTRGPRSSRPPIVRAGVPGRSNVRRQCAQAPQTVPVAAAFAVPPPLG